MKDRKLSEDYKELKMPKACNCGGSIFNEINAENDCDYGYKCYYELQCENCNEIVAQWAYGWFEWTITEGYARPNR